MKQRHIQHLYNRIGFGIDISTYTEIQSKSKKNIVSNLFKDSKKSNSLNINLSDIEVLYQKTDKRIKKEFGYEALQELKRKRRNKLRQLNYSWIDRLNKSEGVLREKMTLFWANIFVCRDNDVFFIQQYNNTLRKHALGDFRTFVKAISKEPAMIKYLNLKQNVKFRPNENFARELMELFTLGVGNYDEKDIKESARAFTGHGYKKNGEFKFIQKKHDSEPKTFFGKTGNFNGDDIIDIILAQKQCARYICSRVYTYFINPSINQKRLEELTNIFYKDYNINTLMKYILRSKWFYNEENIGVKIKSPIELLTGIQTILPLKFKKKKVLNYLQKMMGQELLYPPNVAGWKGGRNWIDSNTLMFRMKLPSVLLNKTVINLEEKGEFEDSFEQYYKKVKKRSKYISTVVDWEEFESKYGKLSSKQLQEFILISKLDIDTQNMMDNLKIAANKDFCIQLMSLPEYQLC